MKAIASKHDQRLGWKSSDVSHVSLAQVIRDNEVMTKLAGSVGSDAQQLFQLNFEDDTTSCVIWTPPP